MQSSWEHYESELPLLAGIFFKPQVPEALYLWPLSPSSTQAKQEYDDALSEGRQAFLLEREENTSDIFTCNLGNLPPGAEATLKLRYVQALAVEPDEAVRFVLPAVLNPRYVPEGKQLYSQVQHGAPKAKPPIGTFPAQWCHTLGQLTQFHPKNQ